MIGNPPGARMATQIRYFGDASVTDQDQEYRTVSIPEESYMMAALITRSL